MSLRNWAKTIPAEFRRLDEHVSTADEYANVRDMHVARENHNYLLAAGLRRNLMSRFLNTRSASASDSAVIASRLDGESARVAHMVFSVPLAILPGVQNIKVVVSGTLDPAGLSFHLYPVLSPLFSQREINPNLKIDVLTESSVSVPVPYTESHRYSGFQIMLLSLYASGEAGSNIVSAGTIAGVSNNRLDITHTAYTGNDPRGGILYFDDTSIEPRVIVREYQYNATQGYIYADRGWPVPPTTANTWYYDAVSHFEIKSVSVYEEVSTDFHESHGSIV